MYLLYRLHGHNRTFLRGSVHLRSRLLRASLLCWPLRLSLAHLLWSLLGNACPWYRSFSLRGVQRCGSGQWMLLYRRSLDWFAPLDGKRPVPCYRLGLPAVDGGELCAVRAGGHLVLLLDP